MPDHNDYMIVDKYIMTCIILILLGKLIFGTILRFDDEILCNKILVIWTYFQGINENYIIM